jgi:hypothetical protein
MKEASAKGALSGSAAWVKFLLNVSDKELARYITAWERALTWYDVGSYSYDSNSRALAGAYEVKKIRESI